MHLIWIGALKHIVKLDDIRVARVALELITSAVETKYKPLRLVFSSPAAGGAFATARTRCHHHVERW